MELKKFIVKTFLTVILPVMALLVIYEYCYRKMPNPYQLKDSYLKKHSSEIEALILGSSHTYFGIDPSALMLPAFNAANVSQDLKYDLFIFEKYKASLNNLKYVVLPISYFSLWSEMEKGQEDWRVRKYQIYMDDHRWPLYKLRYNFEFTQLGNKELLTYHLYGKTGCDCTSLGMGTSYALKFRKNDWESTGKIAAQRHTSLGKIDSLANAEKLKNNVHYLDLLIEECNRLNISVIVVTMPAYCSYYEELNRDQLSQMYSIIENLNTSNKFQYLNLLKDTRFDENDFYDADHLNEYGAHKVSLILNDFFNNK